MRNFLTIKGHILLRVSNCNDLATLGRWCLAIREKRNHAIYIPRSNENQALFEEMISFSSIKKKRDIYEITHRSGYLGVGWSDPKDGQRMVLVIGSNVKPAHQILHVDFE